MGVSRGWAPNFSIFFDFLIFSPTFLFQLDFLIFKPTTNILIFLILTISFVEIYNPPAMTKFRQKYYF